MDTPLQGRGSRKHKQEQYCVFLSKPVGVDEPDTVKVLHALVAQKPLTSAALGGDRPCQAFKRNEEIQERQSKDCIGGVA